MTYTEVTGDDVMGSSAFSIYFYYYNIVVIFEDYKIVKVMAYHGAPLYACARSQGNLIGIGSSK